MPVDPSIFGGRPQMRSVEDFDRQAVDLANQRVLGDMGRLNLLAKQREFAAQDQAANQANALAALQRQMAGASDPELAKAYRGRGYFGEAQALEGKMLGQQETQSKIAKTAQGIEADKYKLAFDRINATRDIVSKAGGKEQLKQLLADAASGDNPVLDVQTVQAMYRDAPDDPAQWGSFQSDALMKTADAKTRIAQISPDANARLQAETAAANRERMAADAAAGRAVQVRGQNLSDARARDLATATRAAGGKPPPGYRFTADGNLEAIPGGPADIKAGELGAKRERQQQGAINQADRIINKVDQALGKVNWKTAGIGEGALSVLPGASRMSGAVDLKSDLETIKANLGFAELQAMRDASPTGGALGAIAVQELIALQSTVASLDQAQNPDQLKARLLEIRKHYEGWKNAVQQSDSPQAQGGDTAVDAALKKYGM